MDILTINDLFGSIFLHHDASVICWDELSQYLPLFKEMKSILKLNSGLGLALPQINVNKAGFLMRKSDKYQIVINPNILSCNEKKGKKDYVEGCLSIPNENWMVSRYREIKVIYRDEKYTIKTEVLTGLDAEVFQHELDHLSGVLISDIGIKLEK